MEGILRTSSMSVIVHSIQLNVVTDKNIALRSTLILEFNCGGQCFTPPS